MNQSEPDTHKINPFIKLLLDIGPLIVYLFAFRRFSETPLMIGDTAYEGLVAAMVFFIPATLIAMVINYVLTREVSRMQLFIIIVTLLIGGITFYLNDDHFVKLRPTIFNTLFGAILAFGVWVQGRSYLQFLMGEVMPLDEEGWIRFTKNFALFFFANAIINEFVRRFMDDQAFAFWDTLGQMGLTFIFIAIQIPMLTKYLKDN